MTKLKCSNCDTLNPSWARYIPCTGCGKMLFNAKAIDV